MASEDLPAQMMVESSVVRENHTRKTTIIGPPAFSPLSIFRHIAVLWSFRDLLYTLTAHRVNVRYKQSALGMAWAIVQPLSLMLIYTALFTFLATMPSDGIPYAVFSFTALLLWTTFATALGNATNGLVSHAGLITKVYFPREILPLSYVIAALVDFLIASLVLAGLLIYFRIPVNANILFAIPIVLLMIGFALTVSLLLSSLQVRYRDIGVGLPLLIQLWMFATPVVYPLSVVEHSKRLSPAVKFLYSLNPMVGLVESFRRVVLQRSAPVYDKLAISVAVIVVLLPLTYAYFKRTEATMADVI